MHCRINQDQAQRIVVYSQTQNVSVLNVLVSCVRANGLKKETTIQQYRDRKSFEIKINLESEQIWKGHVVAQIFASLLLFGWWVTNSLVHTIGFYTRWTCTLGCILRWWGALFEKLFWFLLWLPLRCHAFPFSRQFFLCTWWWRFTPKCLVCYILCLAPVYATHLDRKFRCFLICRRKTYNLLKYSLTEIWTKSV